jgi:hypothetical protein
MSDFQTRLNYNAERFYYAGIITSAPFDAANISSQRLHNVDVDTAARCAFSGNNRGNYHLDIVAPIC